MVVALLRLVLFVARGVDVVFTSLRAINSAIAFERSIATVAAENSKTKYSEVLLVAGFIAAAIGEGEWTRRTREMACCTVSWLQSQV